MKKALLSLLVVLSLFACQQSDKVVLENGKLRLEFDKENATLLSMVDLETGYEYLDTEAEPQRLWNIIPLNEEDVIAEPTEVKVEKLSNHEVKLTWSGKEAFTLVARVRLDNEKPLSYWSVEMSDYDGAKVKELIFPYLTNIKAFTNEEIVLSDWTGALYKNPRATQKSLSLFKRNHKHQAMQLSAIYGDEPSGLYIATNDTESYGKNFLVEFREALTDYQMINILDVASDKTSYKPSYDFILGTLHGDWYDAALIYREWALQQEWVKNSRLHRSTQRQDELLAARNRYMDVESWPLEQCSARGRGSQKISWRLQCECLVALVAQWPIRRRLPRVPPSARGS